MEEETEETSITREIKRKVGRHGLWEVGREEGRGTEGGEEGVERGREGGRGAGRH